MVPRKNVKTTVTKAITTPMRKKQPYTAKNSQALRDELKQLRADQSLPVDQTANRTVTLVTNNFPVLPISASTPRYVRDPIIDDEDLDEVDITIVENLSPSKASKATGEPLSIIYLDIFKLNGEKFDSIISRAEAKSIWRALKQGTQNINRITTESVQGNYIRIGYEVKTTIKVTELSNKQDFTIEINRGVRSDVYKVRLVDFQKIAFQIGDVAKVIVFNCGLEVKAEDIKVNITNFCKVQSGSVRALYRYISSVVSCISGSVRALCNTVTKLKIKAKGISGSVRARPISFDYFEGFPHIIIGSVRVDVGKTIKIPPALKEIKLTKSHCFQEWVSRFGQVKSEVTFPTAEDGIGTDEWMVDVKLTHHIPQILPIKGNRATVYYPGIPKQCKKCFQTDHTAPFCKNSVDWLEYVANFVNTGLYPEQMFGRWMETLRKYHPQFNRNPNDLRHEIELNKRGVPTNDLRRKIGESSTRDLRTNIGNDTAQNHQAPSRGKGQKRGYRGRGGLQYQQPIVYHQPQLVQQPQYYQPQFVQYPQFVQQQPVQQQFVQEQQRGRGRGRGGYHGKKRGHHNQQNFQQ